MNELISIIIPVYNCEKYVENCLDYLVKQTYKNIEIIVIDDGSTDESLKICNSYSKKDGRIKVYSIENSGVSYARNYGIKVSTGSFVGFVDCDDWVKSDYIEKLYENYLNYDADLSVIGYEITFNRNSNLSEKSSSLYVYNQKEAYNFMFQKKEFNGFVWNRLYKKSIIEIMGERPFPIDIAICEDTVFNAKYLSYCNNIVFNSEKKYYYYQRINSATKSNEVTKKNISVFSALDLIEDIMKSNGLYDLTELYIFYLYNYYILKNKKNPKRLKFDTKRFRKIYLYIMKSKSIRLIKKAKITFKYFFPHLNFLIINNKKGR